MYPNFPSQVMAMHEAVFRSHIKLYDPKNCFFTHCLTGKYRKINYGHVDVQNRVIVFDGAVNSDKGYYGEMVRKNAFSLSKYFDILFRSQDAQFAAHYGSILLGH